MSQPKRPRTFTTRQKISPSTHTTIEVHVVRRFANGASPSPIDGAEVELVGLGPKGRGKTNARGVFRMKLVPAGVVEIRAHKAGFGPPTTNNRPVVDQESRTKHSLLPNTKLPAGVKTNVVIVELMLANPRIHITVFEQGMLAGSKPLAGADVDVIGLNKGQTDANGRFSTRHAEFGVWTVKVGKSGFFPQNQAGQVFFRDVTLTTTGFAPNSSTDRDIHLEVTLGTSPPTNLPINVSPSISIWASGGATPHLVLEDPRIPKDTVKGQAGWDMGINFGRFGSLTNALSRAKAPHLGEGDILEHSVRRLAIVSHGAPGVVDVDQSAGQAEFGAPTLFGSKCLTPARLGAYRRELNQIASALRFDSIVILAACQAGEGTRGEELLRALSRLWPTTTVVGIRTIATTVPDMSPPGVPGGEMFAGVRDTNHANGSAIKNPEYKQAAFILDLKKMPWMSEHSPHATLARDGNIIRRGAPPSR